MKEARFYEREGEDGAVVCSLCAFRCRIPEGKRGSCGVRLNRSGTLYSLVYGRLIARHMDPIEKKPLYHFLPGTLSYSIATPGCNFRCSFCQNWQISQTDPEQAFDSIAFVEPERVVEAALKGGARTIAYTYTEPTIFMEYALDCAELAHREGLGNVFVTNGFESPEAVNAMRGLIDAANIDVKAFSDDYYRRWCRARLEPVLDSVAAFHEAGIHVEVTTLVVPGRNDSEDQLRGIARFIAGVSPEIPWHISRFHPDYRELDLTATPLETLLRAYRWGKEEGLSYVYIGNVLTEEGRNTECPDCGRVLIERAGFGHTRVRVREPRCPGCGRSVNVVLP